MITNFAESSQIMNIQSIKFLDFDLQKYREVFFKNETVKSTWGIV